MPTDAHVKYRIQVRRMLESALPVSAPEGEPLITTDTHRLFIGTGSGLTEVIPGGSVSTAYVDAGDAATLFAAEAYTDAHVPSGVELQVNKDTDGTFAANSDVKYPSQKAAKTYVDAKVSALVNSSLSTLDTLKELADALGDDPNFATTISTLVGTKASSTSLATEISDRVAAIANEATLRIAADLAEATARASADTTLTTNVAANTTAITNEVTRATAAEALLATSASVTDEASTRAAADALKADKTYVDTQDAAEATARGTDVTAEATTRAGADSTLTTNVATNTTAISNEVTRATAAEALAELLSHKDAASGYAGLDASSLLKTATELPTNLLSPILGGGIPLLRSLKVASVLNRAMANGQDDLYTVPTGKRAVFAALITNFSGGALTITEQLKIGGSYYTMGASPPALSIGNNTSVGLVAFNAYPIAEANDIISIFTSGSGLHIFAAIFIYGNTECLLSPRLTSLASGDNTLYTCPAGKIAYPLNLSAAGNAPFRIVNTTGLTRTYNWNCVPSGGSPATANKLAIAFTLANNTVSNTISNTVALVAGDFISINSDSSTAGQTAYVANLIEIPA